MKITFGRGSWTKTSWVKSFYLVWFVGMAFSFWIAIQLIDNLLFYYGFGFFSLVFWTWFAKTLLLTIAKFAELDEDYEKSVEIKEKLSPILESPSPKYLGEEAA